MTAVNSTERVRLSRARKAAREFASAYLVDGELVTTIEKFIEGKELEVYKAQNVQGSLSFDAGFINTFYKHLEGYDSAFGSYAIIDMLEAWKMAEKECYG